MSKTRGFAVVSGLVITGWLYVGTAAAQTITANNASGSAGSTVSFSVTLGSGGVAVGGTQNDISFDATNAPIKAASGSSCLITTTTSCTADGDCPLLPAPFTNEACLTSGHCAVTTAQACTANTDCPTVHEPCLAKAGKPDCAVNAAIGKQGFFSFLPNFCSNDAGKVCVADSDCTSPGTCTVPCSGAACTSVRALVVSVENTTEIPDGSTLYSCNVAISATPTAGPFPLTVTTASVGDTSFPTPGLHNATGVPGQISLGGPTPYWVCDVAPASGDNVTQFGNNSLNIADVKAIFKASLDPTHFAPAAGTARFSAMDAAPADNPTACGGNNSLNIADVKLCFKRSLSSSQANYLRTGTGASCTSQLK